MRDILDQKTGDQTAQALQACLVELLNVSLQLKQAHWNLRGSKFRSLHLQLDEIVESTRTASDDVAERIATLNRAPDGRCEAIASQSTLKTYPEGFLTCEVVIETIADRLLQTIEVIRNQIATLSKVDPVSEDLLIGLAAGLEKHLWMLQSQE